MNHHPQFTEKTLIEEKTTGLELQIAQTNTAANPQAIPALVAAPVVLSQVPPIAPSDAKPVVDKASTIAAPTLGATK